MGEATPATTATLETVNASGTAEIPETHAISANRDITGIASTGDGSINVQVSVNARPDVSAGQSPPDGWTLQRRIVFTVAIVIVGIVVLIIVQSLAPLRIIIGGSSASTTASPTGTAEPLTMTPLDPAAPATREPINTPVTDAFLGTPTGRDVQVQALPRGGVSRGDDPKLYGRTSIKTQCTPQEIWKRLSSTPVVREAWVTTLKGQIKKTETLVHDRSGLPPGRGSTRRPAGTPTPVSSQIAGTLELTGGTPQTTASASAAIEKFVATLTPVVLRADTLVVDHGLRDHTVTTYRSVLQVGTVVLVDAFGTPVTKCYSGNPLTVSPPANELVFTGPKWPEFSSREIVTVGEAEQPVPSFTLVDVFTGQTFTRPVGSTKDTLAPPTLTTAALPTTPLITDPAPPITDPSPPITDPPIPTPPPTRRPPFSFSLISPQNGATVQYEQLVQGTINGLPEGRLLWAFVRPASGTRTYHPQPLKIKEDEGTWGGTCFFGTRTQGTNQHYTLIIVTLTPTADKAMQTYLEGMKGQEGNYPGLENLPDGTSKPLATVDVSRS